MVLTTFVVFLGTSRYMYGLGLTQVNDAKVPYVAVGIIFAIVSITVLLNNVELLVKMADVGLIVTMVLISAATTVSEFYDLRYLSSLLNGFTSIGFGSLLFFYFSIV